MSSRVVIFGTSAFGIPAFEKVVGDARFQVVAIVTQSAKPTGRHQELTATAVGVWGQKKSLPMLTPKSLKTEESRAMLRELGADIFLVASYGLILPQGVLDIPAFGSLNIHGSLLPKYRGASPVSAAILHGDQETGITYIVMDAGCDTGPMLKQLVCPIEKNDTRITLEERLSQLAASEIVPTLDEWQTMKLKPQAQPTAGVTLAPRLTREDGRATWDDAEKLERQIRAYQPWPGLWTTWKQTEIKILAATVVADQPSVTPGTIVAHGTGWAIACDHGYLLPTQIQFSGKKPQPAKNVPGSYPDFIGARLV